MDGDSGDTGRATPSPWSHPVLRAAAWGLAFCLAGELGVRLSLPDRPLSLVAPSAGVAVLWFSLSTRRTVPYDVAVLAVVGPVLSARLGLPDALVVFGVLISLAQVGTFVLLMRRWRRDLVPFGGTRREWGLADLGAFLAAAVLSALVVAALSTGSQALAGLPSGDLAAFLVRWGRISSTIVAVASLGLLVAARGWGPGGRSWARLEPARTAEAVALVATTAALYAVCFGWREDLPLSFVLLIGTVWAGIRFSPVAAAAHGLLTGALAVGFTLTGHGVFASAIADPAQRAVVAQLFVLITSMTGLSLSIARAQLARAERLAASRLQLIDQVLREVDDGIVVVRADGEVLVMNPAGRRLMGLAEDLEHVVPAETFLLYEADGSRVTTERAPYLRALRGERVAGEELELRREDGSVLRYLRTDAELLPALDPEAAPRVLVTYHDVTADRLRQDALATFAGHVAHDLRNPLAVVEAWNEILEESFQAGEAVSADEGAAITRRIGGAAVRMRDFIQALLDYTIARDRELKREPVDLVAVASDVAEARSQPVAGAPVPAIRIVGAGCALADAQLLRMVLDNLVANAVKYVAPGVRPDVLVLVEQSHGQVEIRVTDNGIGIPPEHRDRVFSAFHRVAVHAAEGSGLGLGISQRIVERHGGSIAVEDSRVGTVVRVTLPHALPRRALPVHVSYPTGAAPQPA
ncbi:hypothetical protein G5V58_01920 [Nocardioides anomalus]|uniref:Sensor-like histidine kinase SenX3 n=1 Tax=Nocardioides anomalus TaxID=2712223 RepID=A0A6G6W8Z2_9ACTN|nr:ATP-binding protein [Nocardioides anomalus]QIG41694.1 hypothetical protein G5V58_01920 [Nocardioides anomalus]